MQTCAQYVIYRTHDHRTVCTMLTLYTMFQCIRAHVNEIQYANEPVLKIMRIFSVYQCVNFALCIIEAFVNLSVINDYV